MQGGLPMFYFTGRIFQVIGLVSMPSAIWIAEFEHSERGAIAIFCAAGLIFLIGLVLIQVAKSK